MTITYTWDFPALEYYPTANGLNQVVHLVHWRLNGTDGTHAATVYGAQALSTSDIDPTKFIAYSNLTANTVQGWVVDAMGQTMLTTYENAVAMQIEALINPPNVTAPPPWFNTSANLPNTSINTSNTAASNAASNTTPAANT